jgi:hypothetical protein
MLLYLTVCMQPECEPLLSLDSGLCPFTPNPYVVDVEQQLRTMELHMESTRARLEKCVAVLCRVVAVWNRVLVPMHSLPQVML